MAIKVLHKFLLASTVARERFRKESVSTTGLNHHGIIQVYCHGIAEDGRPYIVMDCLEGRSLSDILQAEKFLAFDRFFNLFFQIIEALDFAHGKGIVHRDIKPSNIIIVKEESGERAIIVDFGLSRILNDSGQQSSTQTGAILGSSTYMSPEQCKGSAADIRSDIYSLGCLMFEALAGSPPFSGNSQMEVMYKHLNEPVTSLSGLSQMPASIARVLQKCLAKDAAARYQTLAELKLDLQKCAQKQEK